MITEVESQAIIEEMRREPSLLRRLQMWVYGYRWEVLGWSVEQVVYKTERGWTRSTFRVPVGVWTSRE